MRVTVNEKFCKNTNIHNVWDYNCLSDKVAQDRDKKYRIFDEIYSNASSPGSYFGLDKVYNILKAKGNHNIGKHTARQLLENQDWYALHKPAGRTFKIVRVRVPSIDNQFDADLVSM